MQVDVEPGTARFASGSRLECRTIHGDSPVREAKRVDSGIEYVWSDIQAEFGWHQHPTLNIREVR